MERRTVYDLVGSKREAMGRIPEKTAGCPVRRYFGMEEKMKINELLHTEYPFIQGGMANIQTGAFAAAVSNAGGLGILIGAGGIARRDAP